MQSIDEIIKIKNLEKTTNDISKFIQNEIFNTISKLH